LGRVVAAVMAEASIEPRRRIAAGTDRMVS